MSDLGGQDTGHFLGWGEQGNPWCRGQEGFLLHLYRMYKHLRGVIGIITRFRKQCRGRQCNLFCQGAPLRLFCAERDLRIIPARVGPQLRSKQQRQKNVALEIREAREPLAQGVQLFLAAMKSPSPHTSRYISDRKAGERWLSKRPSNSSYSRESEQYLKTLNDQF